MAFLHLSFKSKKHSMRIRRRGFIASGIASFGLAAYSMYRGIRVPPVIWEPPLLPTTFGNALINLHIKGAIRTKVSVVPNVDFSLRAYEPEPSVIVKLSKNTEATISLNNISPHAQLNVDPIHDAGSNLTKPQVTEHKDGITRLLTIRSTEKSHVNLHYSLPVKAGFRFAAIGDTGGQKELRWCIQRAHDLDALFLLHLGDFYYDEGDYTAAIEAFNAAPLPVYVAIGNHDFHDGKLLYHSFLDNIGPFNNAFLLGGVQFANIDSASNLVPWNRGQRGELLGQLVRQQNAIKNAKKLPASPVQRVAFTHRPLFDPVAGSTHDIGNSLERDWLINMLEAAGFSTLLSGHIHIHARAQIGKLDNIIVGQGLGHQDLITNSDYSKIAIGRVSKHGGLSFEFAPLSMPMREHCHPRTEVVKQSLRDGAHAALIADVDANCER